MQALSGSPVDPVDLATIDDLSRVISANAGGGDLPAALLAFAIEQTGALRGVLLRVRDTQFRIEAEARTTGPVTPSSGQLLDLRELPHSVLHEVVRTAGEVLLNDACEATSRYAADPYIRECSCRSVVCLPVLEQARVIALLYLENARAPQRLGREPVALLRLLAAQLAIALDHASLRAAAQADRVERSNAAHTEADAPRADTGQFADETAVDLSAFNRARPGLPVSPSEMQKLVSLIENSTDCIGYARSIEHVDYVNAAWRRLVGLEPDEELSKYKMTDFLRQEDYHSFLEEIVPVLMRDGHWQGERALRHIGNDTVIPVHQTIFFITEAGSTRTGIATICRDITERKRMDKQLRASLEEKEALLTEVHHRVKNNLQLISSLLSLQADRSSSPDVVEQFAESRNRVRAMALVHENLYRAGNFARIAMRDHIETLCSHLLRAYRVQGQQVELSNAVAHVELDLDEAVSVGLLVNELVSNALKHAFPGGRRGSIRVALSVLPDARCELSVGDDGIGIGAIAVGADSESLGLQLVHDLTRQLGGSVEIARVGGTSFSIVFPVGGRTGTHQ